MLNVTEVTFYQTKDGAHYQNQTLAMSHAVVLELVELFNERAFIDWHDAGPTEVSEFLVRLAPEVMALLKELPDEPA
jgi:hypothetical protein